MRTGSKARPFAAATSSPRKTRPQLPAAFAGFSMDHYGKAERVTPWRDVTSDSVDLFG
jgi:hypothetical protein